MIDQGPQQSSFDKENQAKTEFSNYIQARSPYEAKFEAYKRMMTKNL